MKTKILLLLLAGCLVALAAWFVHVPNSSQADQIPEKYRGTVEKGLEYLVKNQHKDGHWEGDDGKHPVAMTGLVGLALLMEGKISNDSRMGAPRFSKCKYAANIGKAVDWLMEKSHADREGLIFSAHESETSRYMQGHGLATLFLTGAFSDEGDQARLKKLNHVLTRAVKYIAKAQSTQGGWYHTSRVEGHDFADVLTTVIQIQALQAAENAGITVPADAIRHAQEYLTKAIGKYKGESILDKDRRRQTETAAALVACGSRVESSDARRPKGESREEWFEYCQYYVAVGRTTDFGRDELIHYYFSQATFLRGDSGDSWKAYRTAMFDQLLTNQKKDGSWVAGDGIGVGPVYSTAVWCTILQLDHGSHPSSPRERYRIISRRPEPRRTSEGLS